MSLNHPFMHEGYSPAYTISATPFVTSSVVSLGQVVQISFPYVTKFVSIKNGTASSNLAISFTENGFLPAQSNYFTLSGSETYTGELRLDRIFLSGAVGSTVGFTVLAGLTGIPKSQFLVVTSSNGFAGVG